MSQIFRDNSPVVCLIIYRILCYNKLKKTVMKKQTLTLLFLSIFLSACNNSKKEQSESPLKIGNTLDISDFDLISVNEREIEKDKLLLIDFWATWCGPCIASFPHLEKLQEKYSDDLQIIAISDEKVDKVNNFLTKKNFNLSFLNDVDRKLFKRFNISGIPISSLISKKGEFLWIGNSKDFEQILIEYLNSGELPAPNITNSNEAYYNQEYVLEQELNFDNFTISEGGDPKSYTAKTQKVDSVLIDIEYISVPVTDVIGDFFLINSMRLINNRPELDNILLNFKVKSETVTYGQGKNRILEDIQNTYKFNIQTKSKNADVYLLKIIDKNLLEKNVETIEGGGYVNRKDGQYLITRLSLNNLASYFESKLKTNIQFEGVDNSKYNFVFDDSGSLEGLKSQLNKVGISISKHSKVVEYIEIN